MGIPIIDGRYQQGPDWELSGYAYYVWRMARFHGGVDVTMPIMASLFAPKDKVLLATLDTLADVIAKESFGTNMAAARRWRGLIA